MSSVIDNLFLSLSIRYAVGPFALPVSFGSESPTGTLNSLSINDTVVPLY